jgi:hypothetical protein
MPYLCTIVRNIINIQKSHKVPKKYRDIMKRHLVNCRSCKEYWHKKRKKPFKILYGPAITAACLILFFILFSLPINKGPILYHMTVQEVAEALATSKCTKTGNYIATLIFKNTPEAWQAIRKWEVKGDYNKVNFSDFWQHSTTEERNKVFHALVRHSPPETINAIILNGYKNKENKVIPLCSMAVINNCRPEIMIQALMVLRTFKSSGEINLDYRLENLNRETPGVAAHFLFLAGDISYEMDLQGLLYFMLSLPDTWNPDIRLALTAGFKYLINSQAGKSFLLHKYQNAVWQNRIQDIFLAAAMAYYRDKRAINFLSLYLISNNANERQMVYNLIGLGKLRDFLPCLEKILDRPPKHITYKELANIAELYNSLKN